MIEAMPRQRTRGASRIGTALRSSWLIGVILLAISPSAWPATCTVASGGLVFGSYDPFSNQNLDGAANISVSCDVSATYSIALSPGSGSYDFRVMKDGIHQLLYNLYTDATLGSVWGDATGGTAVVGATNQTAHHTVYGRIAAGQNAHVGNYNDTIVITLTF